MDSSADQILSKYPHINEENIPDGVELTRLVELIRHHEKLLQDLSSRLEEAERKHEALHHSYDKKVSQRKSRTRALLTFHIPRILSSVFKKKNEDDTESFILTADLEAAEEVEHLARQVLPLREDLKMLQSPMHPIRRCPTDILQHIFEWVVMSSDSTDNCETFATDLSQVCYRWRQVTISTSKFWSYPKLSLKRFYPNHPDDFEAYWGRLVERIRTCGAVIHIWDIEENDVVWERFRNCRLDLLPNIQLLQLSFNTIAAAERLATDEEFRLPKCPIEKLELQRLWSMHNAPPFTVDPGRLISRFSTITKVLLRDFDFVNFTSNSIFSNIQSLKIQRSTNVPLNLLAQVFPNLEDISLYMTEFREYYGGRINWPKMTLFIAYSTKGIPWHQLKLPKLNQLLLPEMTSADGLMSFISSHPSLWHLHGPKLQDCYHDVAKCAPQLVCLSMPASAASAVLQLNNIVSLRLFQHTTDELSCELFEEIVRKYFLPSRQFTRDEKRTAVEAKHPTCVFKICIPADKKIELLWKESPLLATAVEGSLEQTFWSENCRVYNLKWD